MAQFKYNDNDCLLLEEENLIVNNNGQLTFPNNLNGIEIQTIESYSIHNICDKQYTNEEKNILLNAPFVTLLNINKSSNIKLLNTSDNNQSNNCTNIVINIKEGIDVNLTQISLDNNNNNNTLLEIICNANSKVKYTNIENNQNDTNNIVNFYIDENINIEIDTLSLNNTKVNNYLNVYLLKENSHLVLNNAIINDTSLTQTYNYNVYHWNKLSESQLTNYAICKDNSILNINSNGIIAKGCSKSKIIQKSKGVILDLTSAISANPLLQIDEFDVEANHGASIGAIDDEDLYYLMSRGLSKSQSEQLIVNGYMEPIMTKIDDEQLKKYALYLINNKLK